MKFKLLSGRYSKNGVASNKGDIISSKKDLCKLFPRRFERVGDDVPETIHVSPPIEEGTKGMNQVTGAPSSVLTTEGEDVTLQFSLAQKIGGIKVFLKDGKYNVMDNDLTLNDKPIYSPTKVKKFLKTFIK